MCMRVAEHWRQQMSGRLAARASGLAILIAAPLWVVGSARADYHLTTGGAGELALWMVANAIPPFLLLVGFGGLWFYARSVGRANRFLALSLLVAAAACLLADVPPHKRPMFGDAAWGTVTEEQLSTSPCVLERQRMKRGCEECAELSRALPPAPQTSQTN